MIMNKQLINSICKNKIVVKSVEIGSNIDFDALF